MNRYNFGSTVTSGISTVAQMVVANRQRKAIEMNVAHQKAAAAKASQQATAFGNYKNEVFQEQMLGKYADNPEMIAEIYATEAEQTDPGLTAEMEERYGAHIGKVLQQEREDRMAFYAKQSQILANRPIGQQAVQAYTDERMAVDGQFGVPPTDEEGGNK